MSLRQGDPGRDPRVTARRRDQRAVCCNDKPIPRVHPPTLVWTVVGPAEPEHDIHAPDAPVGSMQAAESCRRLPSRKQVRRPFQLAATCRRELEPFTVHLTPNRGGGRGRSVIHQCLHHRHLHQATGRCTPRGVVVRKPRGKPSTVHAGRVA